MDDISIQYHQFSGECVVLNIAVLGAGKMAAEHIKSLSKMDDVCLAGIYSRTREKAESLAGEFSIKYVADNVDDLYQRTSPGLILVTVNVQSAFDILKKCIPYRVPIFTEKPIALNYSKSKQIREIADDYNTRIWVGLNRRSYSSTRYVLNDLKDFNGARSIHVFDQQDLNIVKKIGHPADVQKYWMYANSIHLVDYIRLFARGNVSNLVLSSHYSESMPATVSATIHYDSGDTAIYTALWGMPGPWGCTVATEEKYWQLQPLESLKWRVKGNHEWHEETTDQLDIKFKPGFYLQAREVVDSLLYGNQAMVPEIDEALETTRLVSLIYETD